MTVSLCVRFILSIFLFRIFFFSVISLLHCRSLLVPSLVKRSRDEAGKRRDEMSVGLCY